MPRGPRNRLRGRAMLAAAVGLALLAGLWLLHVHRLESELLRTDDSAIAQRPDLLAFARARAVPAYAKQCAACHGKDLRGDPARGAPSLIDAEWLYGARSATEIERTIAYGIRSGHPKAHNLAEMPAFGRPAPGARYHVEPLAPQDLSDILDYLFQIEGRSSPDAPAAARGAALFAGRGQCFDCHAADAEGDDFIGAPNLRANRWTYGDGSRAAIARSILHGRAGVCPAWDHVLSPATIRALAIYIHGLAPEPAPIAKSDGSPPHA